MQQQKILFIDRDGTLIIEPEDEQIDSLAKFSLLPGVINALQKLTANGFRLVMISNQDGLGTSSFPTKDFEPYQNLLISICQSQGIKFDDILICPHFAIDNCDCRKPKLGLTLPYLQQQKIDTKNSYVIGDRDSDIQLAKNLGIKGIKINPKDDNAWQKIVERILNEDRIATVKRHTKETEITVSVNLDKNHNININSGIGFFDHMLEQIAKHGGFSLQLQCKGDLHIDDHHTIEDCALALGDAIRQALNDKRGINRYSFLLPMDESLAYIALDLGGRSCFKFTGEFKREHVGGLATEMVPHFFQSLGDSLKANIHLKIQGENTHHQVEAAFKALGRVLGEAIKKTNNSIPSSKGLL
jgi:imidazoleglycerol-phosphate dehydratase / histidinol-phosphatase